MTDLYYAAGIIEINKTKETIEVRRENIQILKAGTQENTYNHHRTVKT